MGSSSVAAAGSRTIAGQDRLEMTPARDDLREPRTRAPGDYRPGDSDDASTVRVAAHKDLCRGTGRTDPFARESIASSVRLHRLFDALDQRIRSDLALAESR